MNEVSKMKFCSLKWTAIPFLANYRTLAETLELDSEVTADGDE